MHALLADRGRLHQPQRLAASSRWRRARRRRPRWPFQSSWCGTRRSPSEADRGPPGPPPQEEAAPAKAARLRRGLHQGDDGFPGPRGLGRGDDGFPTRPWPRRQRLPTRPWPRRQRLRRGLGRGDNGFRRGLGRGDNGFRRGLGRGDNGFHDEALAGDDGFPTRPWPEETTASDRALRRGRRQLQTRPCARRRRLPRRGLGRGNRRRGAGRGAPVNKGGEGRRTRRTRSKRRARRSKRSPGREAELAELRRLT